MLEHSLERGKIGMDVGNQGKFHGRKIRRGGGKRRVAVRKLHLLIAKYAPLDDASVP
jgi:hypothetical protein